MKQLLLALTIGLTAMGCARYGQEEQLTTDLKGTWQLIEEYNAMMNWQKVSKEDQYTYTFKSDSTFTSTKFSDCGYGTYRVVKDTLKLTFTCPNFQNPYGLPTNTLIEIMKIENGNLILSPKYLFCIEGCDEKFQKMSNN